MKVDLKEGHKLCGCVLNLNSHCQMYLQIFSPSITRAYNVHSWKFWNISLIVLANIYQSCSVCTVLSAFFTCNNLLNPHNGQ